MKLILKILKLFAILIITVSVILFSVSFLLQDKVADIILNSLNNKISTKLDVGSFKLSFLTKFPKASLELKNVLVHSSTNFSNDAFKTINSDTLLAASVVFVEFRITDIIKGNYKIERIGIKSGRMNFFTDPDGLVNYDISPKTPNKSVKDFTIDLDKVYLSDIITNYNNLATKLIIIGLVKDSRIKSRISGDNIDFTSVTDMEINRLEYYGTRITKTISADLDLNLHSSKKGIIIKKGVLGIVSNKFVVDGFISKDKMLELNISGQNVDISKISSYLPEKYQNLISDYEPSGVLIIESKIKGILTRTSNLHIEINCLLNNGKISYGKSDITINNLSFAGYFSNGSKNLPETSSVSVKNLKAKLGSAEYTGSFSLSHFNNPTASLILKGKIFPGELKEFFNLQGISTASGSVDMNLNLSTVLSNKGKYTFLDIIEMKPKADVTFNSLTIGFNNDKYLFNQVIGNVSIADSIHARNLQATYKGQRIKLTGDFINLPEWLSGLPVNLIASADISSNRLIPELILNVSHSSDSIALPKPSFSLPEDIILDLSFKIDSLYYKSFLSSKIAGTLNLRPGLLTFKSLSMQSLNGTISGSGFIVQSLNKTVLAKGSFKVTDLDVNRTFKTFKNFGQDFILAENVAGSLSGSFSLLLPLDSMLLPQIKSLTAEGKYLLVNGSLINFDPVKQLSSFIELSELENISFEQLENDFFIKNNILFIPQMEVKSSVANLSVNGKHSFDNEYEYHVKLLLSEILSKKRKKSKRNVSEFGVVQDDGLDRTSLLLKIDNKGGKTKVGYDLKASGSELKNKLKSEKQTLKTIMNQEYGWYKSDTVSRQVPVAKKSRFKISWDETDSVKKAADIPVEKKQNIVKSIFKKY